jgi:lysyl-tRNA synthetase class 2
MSTQHLSEQEQIRRDKLAELKKLGIDPYPAPEFPVTHTSVDIKSQYSEENKAAFAEVSLAGRVMNIKDMGKANFAVLQDHAGKIQIYVKRDDISPGEDKTMYDLVWKKLVDIGDIIGIKGYGFITKMGEISVHVKEFVLLSKSLKPLPVTKEKDGETFDAVTDPEFRYRQRYVDLVINPAVRETFVQRTKLVNTIRQFLNDRGALEVDTPVLQSIPGGATARPFITHHNALDTFALPMSSTSKG